LIEQIATKKNVVDEDLTIKCLKLLCAYFRENFQLLVQKFEVKETTLPFLTLVIFSLFLYFSLADMALATTTTPLIAIVGECCQMKMIKKTFSMPFKNGQKYFWYYT
jgi:hypothetical protein